MESIRECTIGCQVFPTCVAAPSDTISTWGKLRAAAHKATAEPGPSRYLLACCVFFAYSLGILCIDIYAFGGVLVNAGTTYTGAYSWSYKYSNDLYQAFNVIHLINAVQFAYSWHGRKWLDPVVWPEYLNVLGAILYLSSSSLYNEGNAALYGNAETGDDYSDDPSFVPDYNANVLQRIHGLEMAAAVVEMVASIGWAWSWWRTFPRQKGRGLTLDDFDFHATINIVLPAVIYLAYNIQVQLDPASYGSNTLYIIGDASYFAGACFYLLAALRDCGFLWWGPTNGRCESLPQWLPASLAPEEGWGPVPSSEQDAADKLEMYDNPGGSTNTGASKGPAAKAPHFSMRDVAGTGRPAASGMARPGV